ncbi:Reverse transcriptase (RNA-dependent DNA polymerase) [Fragilaria crotonensis]|nr:Reverse transcriptase (RNA-dependent DNA polymerase) [Fragilaria crotonensis]
MSSNSSTAADTTTSGLTTDTGRSNPPGRTGGRGRGRGGRGGGRGHARSTASRPRSSGFKGTTPEMNGNVFECYDEQTDRRQYMKTLEALEGYAKKTLKYAEDLSPLFASEMKLPVLEKPARPGEEADETDIAIWNEDVRDYAKRKRVLRGNLAAIHAVIWGQCSESMKAKGLTLLPSRARPHVPAPPRTRLRSNPFLCPLRCSNTTATSYFSSVPDRTHSTMVKEIQAILRLYADRGFRVRTLHVDHEFACVRNDISPVHLDVVAPDSHVGEIERSVCTVKERLRSTVHGLPFKRLPKLMIVHMVADAVRCLNMFPADNGVSSSLSPLSIVTGVPPPDYASLRLEFGSYVQLFQDHSPSNTIAARTLGAIALTPTGNAHGDYHFLSLASGCRVSRHRWTALPMTDIAIARVETLALHEKQPLIQEDGLVVEWRPNQPVDVDEYDRDYVPPLRDDVDDPLLAADYPPLDPTELADLRADAAPLDDAPFPAVAFEDQGAHIPQPDANPAINNRQQEPYPAFDETNEHNDSSASYEEDDEEDADEHTYDDTNGDYTAQEDDEGYEQDHDEPHVDADADFNHDDAALLGDDNDAHDGRLQDDTNAAEQGANTTTGTDQGAALQARYNFRNRVDSTARRFRTAMDEPFNNKSYFPPTQLLYAGGDIFCYIMDMCATDPEFAYTMTQMSANAGIKKHGRKAMEALMAEFAQLEDLTAYEPLDPTKLTRAQRNRPSEP